MTPAYIFTPFKTGFISVWECRNCCCLPLVVSVYVYLYHSTEHFRPQRPHRKELKPGIADDIIKLLNEIAVPVEEGWDYTTRSHCGPTHTQEDAYCILTDPHAHTHKHTGRKAYCGVWGNCRVPSCFLLQNRIFFPPHCNFLNHSEKSARW